MSLTLVLVVIFVLGYLAIAFEHPLKINKAAPALLIGVLTWTAWVIMGGETHLISEKLSHHLAETAEILFFLLGAMTIVEMVDSHQGFKIITNRIKTKDSRKLLWIISILTFFLSAVLDNLTTSIVMVSLLRRLVHDDKQRIFFASMVIVAANAGGAWSPIGDVTTTMLWIKGQISAANIIETLLVPSLVCMAAPLIYLSFKMKGEIKRADYDYEAAEKDENVKGSKLMFFLGVSALLFVPIFKTVTHLPPYMGMLLGLAVIWAVSELIHIDKDEEEKISIYNEDSRMYHCNWKIRDIYKQSNPKFDLQFVAENVDFVLSHLGTNFDLDSSLPFIASVYELRGIGLLYVLFFLLLYTVYLTYCVMLFSICYYISIFLWLF